MKNIILIFILVNSVFASNEDYELKLYEKVIGSIFNQPIINIYSDEDLKKILKKSNKFVIVNNCNKAVLMIGKKFKHRCSNLPWFATNYKLYKSQQNIIGAFYWRKGRPQLKLKSVELDKFHLKLPKDLLKYAQ